MPRQRRRNVLSSDAAPPNPTRTNTSDPHDRTHTSARTAQTTSPQAGLPLDSLSPDQLGVVIQRQNMALRRQNVVLARSADGAVMPPTQPVVLRVPMPARRQTIVPEVAPGRPVLPHFEYDAFIQEQIVPRLPEAHHPPAPAIEKKRRLTRSSVSYLFHPDSEYDRSCGGMQSASLAPTSVVYGSGCSYLSLDPCAVGPETSWLETCTAAALAEAKRRGSSVSRPVTSSSEMPPDAGLLKQNDVGLLFTRSRANSSILSLRDRPPAHLYGCSTYPCACPLLADSTPWLLPTDVDLSERREADVRGEGISRSRADSVSADPLAVSTVQMAEFTSPVLLPLSESCDSSMACDGCSVQLASVLEVDEAIQGAEYGGDGDLSPPKVRRMVKPAQSVVSVADASQDATRYQASHCVAQLGSTTNNDCKISF